ncbi:DUF1345 domain-containing protein [Lentzea flaviverrucosa]|uniref:Uncharacterized membrane protein n=1 Tax=Lentzea flaviverrucosa TaxID=200379 RepID=A0A1H9XF16_9PSEU|nr:DUF1345 domain-containing protein [Lentzea flaviverrucosa]RDI21470.1 putative membrane protein [Lentzea flaviverrucosa]SES44704.1 Uncharacterized membrane protein [Lentzea flaviverrucosa]
MRFSPSIVLSRILEGTLALLGVPIFFADVNDTRWIALWDLIAVVYLMIRVIRLSRGKRAGDDQGAWVKTALGRRSGTLFTLFTSLVGITSGLTIVLIEEGTQAAVVDKAFGVLAVLLAWAILHFGYADRYAQAYYSALPEKLLAFPGTEHPTYIDFTYFSFTVGTTFAVSDVDSQTSGMRLRILAHGVLSFIYNTAMLGIAIGVISG